MANSKTLTQTVTPVKRGTPEMEALLSVGYGMTFDEAQQIVKERDSNPHAHSYDAFKSATAFLKAYNAGKQELTPSSKRAGWTRSPNYR